MTNAGRLARNVVALLGALLVVDYVIWHVSRFSVTTAAWLVVLGTLPWALMAPALWRGNRRRHVWATLLTAPYLGYGLMEVLANPGARVYAGALVLLACGLFVALIVFLRVTRPRDPAPT